MKIPLSHYSYTTPSIQVGYGRKWWLAMWTCKISRHFDCIANIRYLIVNIFPGVSDLTWTIFNLTLILQIVWIFFGKLIYVPKAVTVKATSNNLQRKSFDKTSKIRQSPTKGKKHFKNTKNKNVNYAQNNQQPIWFNVWKFKFMVSFMFCIDS